MINVLAAALRIIPTQTITYKKWLGHQPNDIGIVVNTYDEPISVPGNIQPAGANTYYKLGIANNNDIFICALRGDALSLAELNSNDIIIGADGMIYNIFKSNRWSQYPQQDWNHILLQRAKNYDKSVSD